MPRFTNLATTATCATLALALAEPAHADPPVDYLQSPSGNIACMLGDGLNGGVACDVAEHTYAVPPRPADCGPTNFGDRIELLPGQAPTMPCHGDTVRNPGREQILDYGQTASLGSITCESGTAGITCTDSVTGHLFRLSRDSYELR